jgi:alginate O-acetyltransferase complex protein AlgI
MLFSSFEFLVLFLPIALILFKAISKVKGKIICLCLMSLLFYSFAGPQFVLVMLVTSLVDFCAGLTMNRYDEKWKRKTILLTALSVNVSILAYFKYQNFFLQSMVDFVLFLKNSLGWTSGAILLERYLKVTLADGNDLFRKIILPAGISFYTFESMSYSIDVYKRVLKPERNYWNYLGFISFFPHLIAGPIVRAGQFLPQLGQNLKKRLSHGDVQFGIFLICSGLIKKVLIANTIGQPVDTLFNQCERLGAIDAWFATLGFGYQIYFDFSGYTDMAIGMAALFGIALPINFNSPYSARNPSDFWRRWHITLSTWFRDYVYIPSGGSRLSGWRTTRNLLLAMFLVGFWHGAAWNFIIWGLYHGLLLAFYHKTVNIWDRLPTALSVALMFMLSMIGWVFFRSMGLESGFVMIGSVFGANGLWGVNGLLMQNRLLLMVPLLTIFIHLPLPNSNQMRFQQWGIAQSFVMAVLMIVVLMRLHIETKFIYFVF